MWTGRTCEACGETWPADAGWCGRCGGSLLPLAPTSRWRPPRWSGPVVALVTVALALTTAVVVRDDLPATNSDVQVVETSSGALPITDATPDEAAVPMGPRCGRGDLTAACVLWSTEAIPDEPPPVAANGRIIGVSGDDLVAVDAADGRLVWRTVGIGSLVFLHAGSEDAAHVLAVDDDRTLHVVDTTDGRLMWSLDAVRPVFPGVLDGHVAVVDGDATVVHDVTTGTEVLRVELRDAMPSGRLLEGGGFASWSVSTLAVTSLDTPDVPDFSIELGHGEIVDVLGAPDVVLVTMGDGRLVLIDRTTASVRWSSPEAFGSARQSVIGDDGVITAWPDDQHGGDSVRVVSLDDGSLERHLAVTDLVGFHAMPDHEFAVLGAVDDGLAVTVLRARTDVQIDANGLPVRIGDRTIAVPGGQLPFFVADDLALFSGSAGATLVDLADGGGMWTIGRGATVAVSGATPTIHLDDGTLHRISPAMLP